MLDILTDRQLAGLALALGARTVAGFSSTEEKLSTDLPSIQRAIVLQIRRRIQNGYDPLGAWFCKLRTAEARRPLGATYTPSPIVRAMVRWAATNNPKPTRVIDPGVGSARFLVAAGRRFQSAELIGAEVDPLAALIARANLAAAGLAKRSTVVLGDYRALKLLPHSGRSLFLGNPPYVRHHLISAEWKAWLTDTAQRLQLVEASQLAGLHVHFFLATALIAAPGDVGAFITSAEWLDVNYGKVLRDLFVGPLGGRSLTIVEPTAQPFPDAATTAAIASFEFGAKPKSVKLKRVGSTSEFSMLRLETGKAVRRERLESAPRWTPLSRAAKEEREGFVELGELCRVHRGQVTGSNKVWISGLHSARLPKSVLFATVTRARELFEAGGTLVDPAGLKKVIDLPVDLDLLRADDRRAVDAFLNVAKAMGVHRGYVAANRKAWWTVGLREPAPILTTYMARRAPAFVRNLADARHINIAHGIYPRDVMSNDLLDSLAKYLSGSVTQSEGRTYAGGLTKFEPKEVERLLVPDPALLAQLSLELT